MNGKPKVLIVDDQAECIRSAREALEALGAAVFVADCPEAAETLFRLLAPDLVLAEVRMPGMNGLRLIDRIRGFVGWERVPIVVASRQVHPGDRAAALEAGADDFLPKPYSSWELRDMVARFLSLALPGALPPAA